MCKSNFHQRRAKILAARAAIAIEMEKIEGNVDQQDRLQELEAEWLRLGNYLDGLEDARLGKPVLSRHAVATKLRIITDRLARGIEVAGHLNDLVADIEDWRHQEPVIWGGLPGRVNP